MEIGNPFKRQERKDPSRHKTAPLATRTNRIWVSAPLAPWYIGARPSTMQLLIHSGFGVR